MSDLWNPREPAFVCTQCRAVQSGFNVRCMRCSSIGCLRRVPTLDAAVTKAAKKAAIDKTNMLLGQADRTPMTRLLTGFDQLDRLFGDEDERGIVYPSVIQLLGEPGAGKSTLILQVCNHLAPLGVLYGAAEEEPPALARRAERLHLDRFAEIRVCCTRRVDLMIDRLRMHRPKLAVMDSLSDLRRWDYANNKFQRHSHQTEMEITSELVQEADAIGCALVLIGHITKDSTSRGLKDIEHLVSTITWIRGARSEKLRTVLNEKNRYGDVTQRAHFHMSKRGYVEVDLEEERAKQTKTITKTEVEE